MNTIFRYVGYAAVAILLGWLSYFGEQDYIASLQPSIVQALVALLTLYSTITSMVISRIIRYKEVLDKEADFAPVIDSLKRNIIIEIVLIFALIVVIIISQILFKYVSSDSIIAIIRNGAIVFTIMYFVIVVYDSSMGLYDLLKYESKNEE